MLRARIARILGVERINSARQAQEALKVVRGVAHETKEELAAGRNLTFNEFLALMRVKGGKSIG